MHKPNQICIVTNVSCLSVPSLCPSSDTDRDSRIVLSCSQWASEVVTTRHKCREGVLGLKTKVENSIKLLSPNSERPPCQTACLSNMPFWILGNHHSASTHKNFHLPWTILKGLKCKGKITKKCHFVHFCP